MWSAPQKLPKIFSPPNYSCEDVLLEIGKHVITSVQLVGYFPLTISKNKEKGQLKSLRFKYKSIPYFNACLLLLLFFINCYIWSFYQDRIFSVLYINQQMQTLTLKATGYLITGSVTATKIIGLSQIKSSLKFWRKFCKGLEEISWSDSSTGCFQIILEGAKHSKIFQKIQKNLRLEIITCVVAWFVYFLIFDALIFVLRSTSVVKTFGMEKTKYALFLTVALWSLLGKLHSLFASFIAFPLKLYVGCLQMISTELAEIVQNVESNRNKNLDEHRLHLCILNYYRISDLLRIYNTCFGKKIILEIAHHAITILGYSFVAINSFNAGMKVAALSRLIPIAVSLKVLYLFGSDSSELEAQTHLIFDLLCRLPHHLLSNEMEKKVRASLPKFLIYNAVLYQKLFKRFAGHISDAEYR